MKNIEITITGRTPLILSKFTEGKANKNESEHEQAERQLYTDSTGKPVVPSSNLLRAIVEAGKYVKEGKRHLTTAKSTQLYGCLFIPGLDIAIDSKNGWSIDSRSVVIPSTGGRIMAHRPIFHEWSLTFTLESDGTYDLKTIRNLIDICGKRIGLGAFRPDRKGPFGTFVVTHWTEQQCKSV